MCCLDVAALRETEQQVDGQPNAESRKGEIGKNRQFEPIACGNFNGPQGLQNAHMLKVGKNGDHRSEEDVDNADPEGNAVRCMPEFRSQGQYAQKQAKALDQEAESHEREAGARPGKQRSIRGKQHSGVVQVRHTFSHLRTSGPPSQFSSSHHSAVPGILYGISPFPVACR